MVYINFPSSLTEEEEVLRQKYAKLRKKRKQLAALKAVKPEKEPVKEKPVKRPAESAEDAKEQAKKLLMSGAIKISDKNQEKKGFKKSRNLEKKLLDPEKVPAPVGFQPFSSSHTDDDRDDREDRGKGRPRGRPLSDNFVRGDRLSDRDDDRRREDRDRGGRGERGDREPIPKKGNTVYVYGHSVTEETLRKAFSNFGTIVNITMEAERHCGFVTFEQMESSETAIQEVDGAMIDGVQLRVSMARRQPSFEQATDASTSSWEQIASSNSQKGSHKDKRNIVTYGEDDIF